MRLSLTPCLFLLIAAGCDSRYYPLGSVPDGSAGSMNQQGGAGGSAMGGKGSEATGGAGGSTVGAGGGPTMGEGGSYGGVGGPPIGGQGGYGMGGSAGPSVGGAGGSTAACGNLPSSIPIRGIKLTPKDLAFRLSTFIWGSQPDEILVSAVASATTTEDVQRLARAMFNDKRFYDGVQFVTRNWLGYQAAMNYAGAPEVMMPASVPGLRASMVTETDTFLQDLLVKGDGTLGTMLLASYSFIDAQMAGLYGVGTPMLPGFTRTSLDKTRRSGILTQPSFLFLNDDISKRGQWVRQRLLCSPLPPPPNFLPVTPMPGATRRETFESLIKDPTCTACHSLIDPIGFAFENYDALGTWRDFDNGKPIDASGTLSLGAAGTNQYFVGARQLSEELMGSCELYRCVAATFLAQGVGRDLTMADQTSVDELTGAFIQSGLSLRELFALTASTLSFLAPAP
jgi:hypothetical protein